MIMELDPKRYVTPTIYERGDIYLANVTRKYMDSHSGDVYDPCGLLNKERRPVVILSAAVYNRENAFVCPIKTNSGHNSLDYEIYGNICLKQGHAGLLCISQSFPIPRRSLTQIKLGQVTEEVLEEIDNLFDVYFGKKPMIKTEFILTEVIKNNLKADFLTYDNKEIAIRYNITEDKADELRKELVSEGRIKL